MYLFTFVTVFIILSICFFFFVRSYYKSIYNYWKIRKVPYINLGLRSDFSLFIGTKSIGSVLNEVYNAGNNGNNNAIQGFFVFHKPWLLIRDVELIKRMLVKDFDCCNRRPASYNSDELGTSTLFFLSHHKWKYVRNKLSPCLSPMKLKKFYPSIQTVANKFVGRILDKSGEESYINIVKDASKYVSEVLSLFVFGMSSYPFEKKDSSLIDELGNTGINSFLRGLQRTCYIMMPNVAKLLGLTFIDSKAASLFRNVFWNNLRKTKSSGILGGNVMQHLIKLKEEIKETEFLFDGDKLVAQGLMFYIGGMDTITITISYTFYELSLNEEIQNRLRNDIKNFTTDGQNLLYEDLNNISYLDMVVNEILRKYPIFPYLNRVCTEDYKIPEMNVTISKGTPFSISLQGIHQDPTHFPNPLKFDPERFSKQNGMDSAKLSSCYMPFGLGARICIAERLAIIATKVAVITVLSKFKINLVQSDDIKFSSSSLATLPQNIRLKFTPIEEIASSATKY